MTSFARTGMGQKEGNCHDDEGTVSSLEEERRVKMVKMRMEVDTLNEHCRSWVN